MNRCLSLLTLLFPISFLHNLISLSFFNITCGNGFFLVEQLISPLILKDPSTLVLPTPHPLALGLCMFSMLFMILQGRKEVTRPELLETALWFGIMVNYTVSFGKVAQSG